MSDFYEKIKRTAYDLTNLEINTIIKSEMNASKLPDNNRLALHFLATRYALSLKELGFKYASPLTQDDLKSKGYSFKDWLTKDDLKMNGFRGKDYWLFSGRRSFRELRIRAHEGMKMMRYIDIKKYELNETDVKRDCKLLERIYFNCIQIIGLFEELRKNNNIVIDYKTYWPQDQDGVKHKDHLESKDWNNDVGIYSINELDDLKIDLKQRLMIRKALDIGVEEIMMQTIVGMDGDITTRILEKFSKNPISFILNTHNESIELSISYWNKIIDALVSIGRNIIGHIKEKTN